MDTMMALRAHSRGGAEQLVYERAPKPVPAPGEVLIAVYAAAITFAELTWDETWTRDGVDRTPIVPSHEVSGVVAELGDGVVDFALGDVVYGLIGFDRDGAAAEFVTVPASDLAPKPQNASHLESASLPLSALTAWQALVNYAEIQPGNRVLVLGGAGGVGVYAVQLAHILGAQVIATAAPEYETFVRGLGADEFIDRAVPALENVMTDVDIVIDTVGGDALADSYRVVREGGRVITLGAPPDEKLANEHGVTATFFIVTADRAELSHIAQLVDDQTLQTVVSQTFPLRDGRAAFESASQKRPPGKTILIVR